MVFVAAATERRYMRCMLSAPPSGELLNICAGRSPAAWCEGK